jgi:hypothetical protein
LYKSELYDIDSDKDKAVFLRLLLEQAGKQRSRHKDGCPHGNDCGLEFRYDKITYYFTQELNRLGIKIDNDQFTWEERENYEEKLDLIYKGNGERAKGTTRII